MCVKKEGGELIRKIFKDRWDENFPKMVKNKRPQIQQYLRTQMT